MVWKCGTDGFDFQSVRLRGNEPELYGVYQAAKAIAVGCCNITSKIKKEWSLHRVKAGVL